MGLLNDPLQKVSALGKVEGWREVQRDLAKISSSHKLYLGRVFAKGNKINLTRARKVNRTLTGARIGNRLSRFVGQAFIKARGLGC